MAGSPASADTAPMNSLSSLRGVDGALMLFVVAVVVAIALGAVGVL